MSALENKIGYNFKDRSLLACALTHSSFAPQRPPRKAGRKPLKDAPDGNDASRGDNERLEFLGDRVLGIVIADMVYQAFPDAREGAMARHYNALVKRATCAQIAREIGLGQNLKLGPSELKSNGADKPSLLGNALEALIGAVYLDGGIAPARKFIHRFWKARLAPDAAPPRADAKTRLQEWAQARALAPPAYRLSSRKGPDHAPVFKVTASLEGFEPVTGGGKTKRAAELAAARDLLRIVGAATSQPASGGRVK